MLAEVVDAVVDLYRQREDDWLADLRARLEPAREKRREAERLLEEAKTEEWQLHQLGQHVQMTADDGPLGRQPVPTPSLPPAQFSVEVATSMLERPWHKRRDPEQVPPSWQELSQADDEEPTPVTGENDEPLDDDGLKGDPTGQLSELDQSHRAAA